MAANTVALTYTAELKDLRKKLASIPDITAAEARKATQALNKSIKAAGRVADKVSKESARAARAASKAAEASSRATREGFKGVVELAGFSGDKIDKLNSVLEATAVPAGAAAAAVGGVVVAVAAVAAGVTAAGVAMVGLVRSAGDLHAEVNALSKVEGLGVSGAAVANIERANRSLDAVAVLGKQVVVVLGAEVAPAVEGLSRLLVKFGLIAIDALNKAAQGGDLFREGVIRIGDALIQNFLRPYASLANNIARLGNLAEALGLEDVGKALQSVDEGFDNFTRGIAESAVDGLVDGFEQLDTATGDLDGRVDALVGKLQTLKDAERDGGKSAEALTKAQADADKARTNLLKTIARQAQAESDLAAVQHSIRVDALEGIEATTQAIEDAFDARLEAISKVAAVVGETEAVLAAVDAAAAERATALGDAWTAQADLVDDAAESMTQAVEDLGPLLDQMPSRFELIAAAASATFDKVAGVAGGVTGALEKATGGAVDLSVGGILGAAAEGEDAGALVDQGLAFIEGLVDNLPIFLDALIAGVPRLIHGLINAVPLLIESLVSSIPVLAVTLATETVAAIINNLPAMIKALAKGIVKAIRDGLKTLLGFFRDLVKEIGSVGRKKTKTFGDTPGPIRVPAGGLRADFGSGDIVVASRSREGAAAQLGLPSGASSSNASGGGGGGMRAVRLDIVDGHVGLDRVFRRNMMNGGALSRRATTGQVDVYNRGR